ncbi:hypothetical protein ABT187_18805 [Streptomyces sp. NPDC001817]|uniref:hypothetical protein n=1 Tax=Streptomyces sp. NPDC001817 TaxID=3154398 RepID=UPI0033196B31
MRTDEATAGRRLRRGTGPAVCGLPWPGGEAAAGAGDLACPGTGVGADDLAWFRTGGGTDDRPWPAEEFTPRSFGGGGAPMGCRVVISAPSRGDHSGLPQGVRASSAAG